jgi:ATP adenylyltransferase
MTTPMWAPWRMEYISGSAKGAGCFLCEHPKDPARFREHLVLVAQPHAFVCLNRYPFTTSHLLVAPRRHVADPTDLDEAEYVAVMALVRESVARLRRAVGCEAMNVGMNLGKAAGAGVADHLHAHVVPRWSGDTNFMPVLADVRVMPEYLDEAWQRLDAAFADLSGVHAAAAAGGGGGGGSGGAGVGP